MTASELEELALSREVDELAAKLIHNGEASGWAARLRALEMVMLDRRLRARRDRQQVGQ